MPLESISRGFKDISLSFKRNPVTNDMISLTNEDAIKKAVAAMPAGYRSVLNLYLFEGYDHAEISEILGITVTTSKTQYHRAKKKLKELLIEYKIAC